MDTIEYYQESSEEEELNCHCTVTASILKGIWWDVITPLAVISGFTLVVSQPLIKCTTESHILINAHDTHTILSNVAIVSEEMKSMGCV